ncbi:hypothetical protein O6P43_023204 [Quillaja saponaria]|uniref:Uncharacterized protein n=1 Tax=Quillaja saponaria TaxID=32244 RepID=A0AAD7LER0_QUISA|nr:hypothetical protein O6P43_023204 [Quillaja saponaria]
MAHACGICCKIHTRIFINGRCICQISHRVYIAIVNVGFVRAGELGWKAGGLETCKEHSEVQVRLYIDKGKLKCRES